MNFTITKVTKERRLNGNTEYEATSTDGIIIKIIARNGNVPTKEELKALLTKEYNAIKYQNKPNVSVGDIL